MTRKAQPTIRLRIAEMATLVGIKNANQFRLRLGMDLKTGYSWYKGEIHNIPVTTLLRICVALNCTPGDLIAYEPDATAGVNSSSSE